MIAKLTDKLVGIKGDLLFSGFNFGIKIIINLLVFSVLARLIEVESFGLISFFIMIVTIVMTSLEFGHKYLVIKDISTDISKATKEYIANKIMLKNAIFIIAFLIILVYFNYKDFWGISPYIMLPFILSGYFLSLSNLNFALFYSVSRYYLETVALCANLAMLVIGLLVVYFTSSWESFLMFYALGSCLMYIVSMVFVKKHFGIGIKDYFSSFSLKMIGPEFLLALPFALIIFGDIVFSSFDSFLVEQNFSAYELGIYEGLKKILLGLSILSLVMVTALMPWISRTIKFKNKNASKNLIIAFLATILGGGLIFIVYYFFNKELIVLLLGEEYLEISTWDSYIAIFVFSKYLRVIPALYLIMANLHNTRMLIIYSVLITGSAYVYLYAIPFGMKYTFKVVTIENLILALLYTLAFFVGLYYKKGLSK